MLLYSSLTKRKVDFDYEVTHLQYHSFGLFRNVCSKSAIIMFSGILCLMSQRRQVIIMLL